MADTRKKNLNWKLRTDPNFVAIPSVLRRISANTAKPRRQKKAATT